MAEYEIREYRPGDETSLVAAFNDVFGRGNPAFVPRTLEEWRWSFLANPAGWRIFVALHAGQVVAQFAGQPFRVWCRGEEQTFVGCIDSMSHPDHRRGLKRPGLFVNVAQAYFEAYGGADRDWMHFGLPIQEAARIGDTFLRYEVVRNQILLLRDVGEGPTDHPAGVENLERFDHQARWLYDRCSGEWGASTIRDDRYLTWRFLEHPVRRYLPLGVRDEGGTLRGLAVYRPVELYGQRFAVVAEWLVPPDEPEVGELLRHALLAQARRDRLAGVLACFPEWSRWFELFQEDRWWVHPTDYVMRARWFHGAMRPEWLRWHWWYQLGETDLV